MWWGVMRCAGMCWAYLDLQLIIATNALAVHLMVSIVSVASALVLDECEAWRMIS